jgi:hypothetical protein
MQLPTASRAAVLIAALCLCAQGQSTPGKEAKGLPPRATPADYQAQAQAGTVTIAAEFMGHGVATPQGVFSTEDFVVVETALFGSADARIKLSVDDFSLRINGKKTALPSQPFVLVAKSLKDPDWEPPVPAESKSKTSFGGSGKGSPGDSTPAPVHMPMELQRSMEQRVQKALLPEGDRALPQAGLVFFQYKGKAQSIHSIELIYTGSAGTATLTLQP